MTKSWEDVENHVRDLASLIWDREAKPDLIGGVAVDCVLKISEDSYILIEITKERNLNKVREDIVKLNAARMSLFNNGKFIHAKCYCVVAADSVTQSMVDAGQENSIVVKSLQGFEKSVFDFSSYQTARQRRQFGSAVNPVTGKNDENSYVKVSYIEDGQEIDVNEIASLLIKGKQVVMTGEYGSGKSRCVKEVFARLAEISKEEGAYPIAIDLRENWGLKRFQEIIRRHFDDMGIPKLANSALKLAQTPYLIFILDGFDEIGFQAWSEDNNRLRNLRMQSLEGVRDLISKSRAGVFICGREHYFNNNNDMITSLGLRDDAIIVKSKDEFSETEMAEYMSGLTENYEIPSWIPRRPLICQTIVSLAEDDLERMFGQEGGDVEFWHTFMKLLCKRDAQINTAIDPETVFGVLVNLSRITRSKSANVGPLTLGEIQKAFEAVVGEAPDEQASVMLQRLPGLGRVKAETNDRQFIDMFILDGARAVDVRHLLSQGNTEVELSAWQNPLDLLGQRIMAASMQGSEKHYLQLANRCASLKNRVLASDIVSSLVRSHDGEQDFNGLAIDEGHFLDFNMTISVPTNLRISNSIFTNITLCPNVPKGTALTNCLAVNVFGITSVKGLPSWADISADNFQAVQNIATIRKLGLKPSQEILVAIIRKTFFQKGAGRKEEALLRGLGKIGAAGLAKKVVNVLLREKVLDRFPGAEGFVYTPIRANAGRMQKLVNELNTSQDVLWLEITDL
jgi:hypothetical protein